MKTEPMRGGPERGPVITNCGVWSDMFGANLVIELVIADPSQAKSSLEPENSVPAAESDR